MNSKDLYSRLLQYVRPYWKIFSIAIVCMVGLSATQPLFPILLKPLLDESFIEKNLESITLMPLLFVLLFFSRGLLTVLSTLAMTTVSSRVVMDIRRQLFGQLMVLPRTYLDNQSVGNLISKITYNVTMVSSSTTTALVVLVQDSLAIVGLLCWMFYLDWKLSLVFFLIVPVAAGLIKLAAKRLRRLSRSLQDEMGNMTQTLQEGITGNKVIKIFGGQDAEKKRFHRINNLVRRLEIKMKTASSLNVSAVELLAAIALAIIIYLASIKASQGEMTVGGFISFFAAMAMLFAPAKRLTKVNEQLQLGLAAAESIFDLLGTKPEHDPGKINLQQAQGHLTFKHVHFRYDENSKDALNDINLDITPGKTIALVGQSGSGKSTLVNLLSRFFDISEGEILLDNININDLTLTSLRKQLSLVSQEIVLFDDSIINNIAYGDMSDCTEEEIMAAAEAAHITEFVKNLPDGMQTRIGDNGLKLSGGQRQRIAIARALLKQAPVLIFDEATSALDTESERFIQDALDQLRKGRTSIIIAHRLSTIKNADVIVVMEKGKIIEMGNHDELLEKNGTYSKLYQMQFATN